MKQQHELVGDFLVAEKVTEGQRKPPFVIEGHLAADGTFWPHVEIQVGNDRNDGWKTVATFPADGTSVKVTIYPGLVISNLTVKFDALKPLIGRYKFGRVILQSGDAAVFELADLSPPEDFKHN